MTFRLVIIGLFVGFFYGCAKNDTSFLGKAYHNFSSYFNAYYNATQEFESGLNALQTSNKIDLKNQFIIFPKYQNVSSAASHFDKVIKKTSSILNHHPNSDLADNALLLMGKAYYYKQEFEPAKRKFQEILTNYFEGDARDEASFWYGRTLVQQNLASEAIEVLQSVIESQKTETEIKAKAYFLIAELYISDYQYEEAIAFISNGLKHDSDNDLKTRAAFCLARLYELNKDFASASKAFEMVLDLGSDYDLRFIAFNNKGIILRENGQLAESIEVFNELLSDDNNLEHFPNLRYELATSYSKSKDLSKAIDLYFEIIRRHPNTEASAKSYFQLGRLRQNLFGDYKAASALYDSAKTEYAKGETFARSAESSKLMSEILTLQESILQLDSLLDVGVVEKAQTSLPLKPSKTESKATQKTQIQNLLSERTRKDYRKSAFLARGGRDAFKTTASIDPQKKTRVFYQPATDSLKLTEYKLELIRKIIELGQLFHLTLLQSDSAQANYAKAFKEIKQDDQLLSDSLSLKQADQLEEVVLFSLADIYRNTGQKTQLDSVYKIILNQHPDSPYINTVRRYFGLSPILKSSANAITRRYEHAIKLLDDGNIPASLDSLKSLLNSANAKSLQPKLYLGIGHIYDHYLSTRDSAIVYYQSLKRLYPNSPETKSISKKLAVALAQPDTLDPAKKTSLESQSSKRSLPEKALKKEFQDEPKQ